MKLVLVPILSALLGVFPGEALACRMSPPVVTRTSIELAAHSDLVFIAHVDKVRPLDAADQAFLKDFPANTKVGVIYTMPTAVAEYTVVRVLKGSGPMAALLQSATWDCGGLMMETGGEYLIFANRQVDVRGTVAPIEGSFPLQGFTEAAAELQKIDTFLTPKASTTL